jgi:hypothetical protein
LDALAAQVKQHGCCSLPGVSIDFWKLQPLIERAVQRGFVSREHGDFALNGLWFGFDMGVDVAKVKGRRWFRNYASANEAKDKITTALRTRVEQAKTFALCLAEKCAAHMLPWPDCRVFPMGAVPKPHEPDVTRPVSDHTKSGLKAATDRESLRHTLRTYDEIAEFLKVGYSMRMMDVEGAFPLLPLAPMLWPFFMLWWYGVWDGSEQEMFLYVHLTADFGAAGVPGTWKVFFTDVIVGVARSELVITLPMPVYVDDCALIGAVASMVDAEGVKLRLWLTAHGIYMKELKERVAAMLQLALGFWWDSIQRTRTLTADKLEVYVSMIRDFAQRRSLTLREMQRASGQMQRGAMTLQRGALCFMASLFALMRGLSLPWHQRRTNRQMRADFTAMADLLEANGGRGYFCTEHMERAPDVYTDASKEARYAGGGYFSLCGRHRHWRYGASASRKLIDELEGDAVLMAANDLAESWRGKVVPLHIDNRSFQLSGRKGWSKAERLVKQLRVLFWLAVKYDCVFEFEWISTHDNIYADALSRPEGEQRFLALVHRNMPWLVDKLTRHTSSGAVRQFGPEYPSDLTGDGPRLTVEMQLARLLICLRDAPTHRARMRHIDVLTQLHGRTPSDAERCAVSIVLVHVHGWGQLVAQRPVPAGVAGVSSDLLRVWEALLVRSDHMVAAQGLLALRVGREFSSDTMGDGPATRAAKVSHTTVPYARGSIYVGVPSAQLAARAQEILGDRLSTSSHQSIQAALGHWRVVCARHGWAEIIVTDDPLRGGKLATYMIYMCDETDLAGVSIGNYVWALRAHMKQSRQLDPALGVAEWDDWSEAIQVQAWVPGEPRRMVPLELVKAALQQVGLSSFQDVQAAVLLLLLLFSFARSETPCPKTAGGLDPLQHLLVEDVVPHAAPAFHIAMRLKRIKQDRRMERPEAQGNEDWIKLGDTQDQTFSLKVWMARLFALHGGARAPDGAFFVNPRDRSQPLTYAQAMAHVRGLYERVSSKAEAAKYGLHSLRVTGYALAKRGVGEELTVAHGGWRSLAHRRYDRFSLTEVLSLPEAIMAVSTTGVLAPAEPVAAMASGASSSAGAHTQVASSSVSASGTAQASSVSAGQQPLTHANCVGRRVLCPHSMWPGRAGRMHGGAQRSRRPRLKTHSSLNWLPESASFYK